MPRGLPSATAPEIVDVGRGLWAVAARVPLDRYGPGPLETSLRDINWVADIAIAHESVVEHFASKTESAVVPMKLFTMYSSHERAATDLEKRRGEIAAVMKVIRGCQEWGMRVTREAAPASRRPAARATSGTAFLVAKKRLRDDVRESAVRAAGAAEAAYAALVKHARASRRREAPENATTPPLVDAALLVPVTKRTRFRAAARTAAAVCRKAGVNLTLTGPWPAYNFVQQSAERA